MLATMYSRPVGGKYPHECGRVSKIRVQCKGVFDLDHGGIVAGKNGRCKQIEGVKKLVSIVLGPFRMALFP